MLSRSDFKTYIYTFYYFHSCKSILGVEIKMYTTYFMWYYLMLNLLAIYAINYRLLINNTLYNFRYKWLTKFQRMSSFDNDALPKSFNKNTSKRNCELWRPTILIWNRSIWTILVYVKEYQKWFKHSMFCLFFGIYKHFCRKSDISLSHVS